MYYKTIFAIAGTIATLAMIAGMAVIPNFQTAAAANDRCVSTQSEDGTGRVCTDNKEDAKQVKAVYKELKEFGILDKVSSSQTGFGEFPNS
jgi:hypothetical protein